jgi:hypothetical protein
MAKAESELFRLEGDMEGACWGGAEERRMR